MSDEKVVERKLLLRRILPKSSLFRIGMSLKIRYFLDAQSVWDIDDDRAANEIAIASSDQYLKEILTECKSRKWESFRGKYYTFEDGELRFEGSSRAIETAILQTRKKYGVTSEKVLKLLVEKAGKSLSLKEIIQNLPEKEGALPTLKDLERMRVIAPTYKGEHLQEWALLEETIPIIKATLGIPSSHQKAATTSAKATVKTDAVQEERFMIQRMDRKLDLYLNDLLKHRIEEVVRFGKSFSIGQLAHYLNQLFGPVLYFDSLLSIIHQYGLCDVEIVHSKGKSGMNTGWNLSLFGEPGTGKSFACRDMIFGKPDSKVPPYGIPGRNRYAGGITPARFIRIGQAYSGRVFNFVVPEFNDWFKYKGMIEPMKLAMERGEIKYETHRETIGPYYFTGFFSVNYNVTAHQKGYDITIQDPNFTAVEDRMLCRLHRLTKQRFVEIAESQMRLAFGEVDIEQGAGKIRDHLTLVYAIETEHPLVRNRFPSKPVMLTPKAQQALIKARKAILDEIQQERVRFSARLEDRAIRFACAASVPGYFGADLNYLPMSEEALHYAIQLYVEEASVRSREEFLPELVLGKLSSN